jgi:hypothetical protein
MDHSEQHLMRLISLPLDRHYLRGVFLFASLIVLGLTAAVAEVTASYYVSGTNGNDSWSGTLDAPNSANTDGPFETLARAQSAMQASTIKKVTIRGGTYSIQSTNLTFSWPDEGETWISYPGETVILDGGGTGYISAFGANNLTFIGLVIQRLGQGPYGAGMYVKGSGHTIRWNKFLNCMISCLSGSDLTNTVVDSNTIDGQSPGNPAGDTGNTYSAIQIWYGSSNNRITHNLIMNAQGGGIAFSAGASDLPNNNNIVDRNILRNVNTNVVDSGAIYMMDRTHTAVGNQITNNIIDGNGGVNFLTNWTKAIYLDDLMSNVLVSGNVCRNCGQYAVHYHAGDRNIVVNNIFDLTGGALLGFYQDLLQYGNYGMTGNVFKQNIVYFANTAPNPLWRWSQDPNDTLMTKPTDTTNLYYSATGASIPNSGQIVDAKPVYANPQFTNPSGGDYSMPATSPAYSLIQFQPLPTDQGPLPYLNPPANVHVIQVSP